MAMHLKLYWANSDFYCLFAELPDKITWTKNIWMGVTIESSDYLNRIKVILNILLL
jgi:protein gp37